MMTEKAEELKEQGIKLFNQHDYEAAVRLFQQAQDSYDADDQADMVAEMKVNRALVHGALGENQQALDLMQEALRIFQKNNDGLRTAQVLGNMGGVYKALGDKEQAYHSYRQAADAFDELGEKELYGETLVAMGDLQMRDGKLTAGAATYQVGLENLDNLSVSQKIIRGLTGIINRLSGS